MDREARLDVEDVVDVDWSHGTVEAYLAGEGAVSGGGSDATTTLSVLSEQVASLVRRVTLT